jgi:hypothetical protein
MKARPNESVSYLLCPRCLRAVPRESGERFCPNDGIRLLLACPKCNHPITSPFNHYCTQCGHSFQTPSLNDIGLTKNERRLENAYRPVKS